MNQKSQYPFFPAACLVFFANLAFSVSAQQPGAVVFAETPKGVEVKLKRDAARLALRTVADAGQLQFQHVFIPALKVGEFYRMLSGIYENHPVARSVEKLDVHTFPSPSIDRLVLIFDKKTHWAKALRAGAPATGHRQFDGLMARYGLTAGRYVNWDDANDAVTLHSQEPLNMAALAAIFSKIEGVASVDMGVPETTGNDIRAVQTRNGWEISYILVFGSHINGKGKTHTWKFQVANDGATKFLGESGDALPAWADPAHEAGN